MRYVVLVIVLQISFTTGAAEAQFVDTRWGITTSIAPTWRVPPAFRVLFDGERDEAFDIAGSEFRVGFVRGRTLAGDWGVSLVRNAVKSGSIVARQSETLITRDVSLLGVEIHRFSPFTTIAERVQIGINVAGGIAGFRGTVERQPALFLADDQETMVDANVLFAPFERQLDVVPIGKIELAVAGILAPGLKIRATGGLNFPGTQVFSIAAVYFFGDR